MCGHLEILDILIEAGAELSTPDSHNAYPIHYAAQMNGKDNSHSDQKIGEKVLKKLLDSGVPYDVTDKDGRQPLLWAASAGKSQCGRKNNILLLPAFVFVFCILHFCHTCSLCHVELVVQFPTRGSIQVLLCLFPDVLWL